MKRNKVTIRTSEQAIELIALLGLKDRRPARDEVPGVWIVMEPTKKDEIGMVLEIVTFSDFYGDEVFQQAEQILELLCGERWNQSIPLDAYPTIERALRTANLVKKHVGDTVTDLKDDVRRAEFMYDRTVEYKTIEYMEKQGEHRITVAKTWARNQCQHLFEKVLEVKKMRDYAENLYDALKQSIFSFGTITSKLKGEYLERESSGELI